MDSSLGRARSLDLFQGPNISVGGAVSCLKRGKKTGEKLGNVDVGISGQENIFYNSCSVNKGT